MKKFTFTCLVLIISFTNSSAQDYTKFVNPFIGTDGHGHTFPGATVPFGLVQLSPDTDNKGWDWCSGYHYSDSTIMGFSHMHLSGTGAADYGDILFMPATGETYFFPGSKDNPDSGYRSVFSHTEESASPGYYSVFLKSYKIKVELTATERCGFQKYTFPGASDDHIILDLDHGISDRTTETYLRVVNQTTIEGYRKSSGWAKEQLVFFYTEFSKPFSSFQIYRDGEILTNPDGVNGKSIKCSFEFSSDKEEVVLVKTGISAVDIDGARKNLLDEIPDWNFEFIKNNAAEKWNRELSKIEVTDNDRNNKTIFYSALYHSFIAPNIFNDVDGRYRAMDGKIHQAEEFTNYTVFSLWDTFRALHPLFTIIQQKRNADMINSMLHKFEQSGLLPVWELASNETGTMIGYHSIPVITDAIVKGITGLDVNRLYPAMKKSAMEDHLGLRYYKNQGFIPADKEQESVSRTLEYAYDDWCISVIAGLTNNMSDYKYFGKRARYYKNLFDTQTGFMRPKRNAKWDENFDPFYVSGDYTEANAWQYTFFVPHAVKDLISLYGSNKNFIDKLDNVFEAESELKGRIQPDISGMIGQYAHGNEPSHHMAYLYNYAEVPWKTQEKVKQISGMLYTANPDGLSGNEDCGQMSAWYVFSSIGFYPVNPGQDIYVIGTPLFEKTIIHLENGKQFIIEAENLSDQNFYIEKAQLNGKDYFKSYIRHSDIIEGGNLKFIMNSEPGELFGTDDRYIPPSPDFPDEMLTVPLLEYDSQVFSESMVISIIPAEDSVDIYYTLDGSDPNRQSLKYYYPVMISESVNMKVKAYKEGKGESPVVEAVFIRIPYERGIMINLPYSPRYPAGGDLALIDMIRGTESFYTGAWQGYEQNDLDVIIDLKEIRKVNKISAGFLQNIGSWIFFPEYVEFFYSTDGESFISLQKITNDFPSDKEGAYIKDYSLNTDNIEARYIKVYAKNIGVCPDWHKGAGGKAWIFADEISIGTVE
ncbi:MAG: hypothetical protein Kow0098_14420 [Ignavibacteriaceae bacterium]